MSPDLVYLPEHFRLEELVSPAVADAYRNKAWRFLDSRLLYTLDSIHGLLKAYSPAGKKFVVILNTWYWGGSSEERGFRPPRSIFGAPYSQHKCGRAADIVVPTISSDEVASILLYSQTIEQLRYIARIEHPEETKGWTHIEVGPRDKRNRIIVFRP